MGDTVKCTLLTAKQIRRHRGCQLKLKDGTVAEVYIYKKFSGNRDNIRHLKTFRVIFNGMPALLLNLSWCYFSCLKVYSDKLFNAYFHEQKFFKIFVAKRDTGRGWYRNLIWVLILMWASSHLRRGLGGLGRAVSPW